MRPKVACEIRPEGVVAARGGKKHGELTMAFAPLPAGTLAPGLKVPNLADRRAVTSALESALGEINTRQEALPVVRFRLRKMVPFDVEGSAVSYQVMAERNGQLIALVTVMPGDVLE